MRIHTVLLPVRSSGNDEGVLEVDYVAGRLEADILGDRYKILLQGSVLVLLLGLITWTALHRLVFRPLTELMGGIERVATGESRAPIPVRSRDELGQVAAAFNRMTERLEEARQRVEAETDRVARARCGGCARPSRSPIAGKLCSSIAHEVGTPLNIIAGRAELMLRALPAGLSAPRGPERHHHPDRSDLPDDPRGRWTRSVSVSPRGQPSRLDRSRTCSSRCSSTSRRAAGWASRSRFRETCRRCTSIRATSSRS